jgi:PAS domain-containing protein
MIITRKLSSQAAALRLWRKLAFFSVRRYPEPDQIENDRSLHECSGRHHAIPVQRLRRIGEKTCSQKISEEGIPMIFNMEQVTLKTGVSDGLTGALEPWHQEALLKAGALQNAIFNSTNFSIIATDAKGVIQIFNVGAERMLGYTAADVVNNITPADISDPQEVIARAEALSLELDTAITPGFEALVFKASRGIEDIYELTYIRKDGSRFPAVVSVTALRDDKNEIIGFLLVGTDNTARKQIEAEQQLLGQRLRDHQFYTRSLFESNIDALMITDPSGVITDVNKQMEALTGCTRDELIGAPFKSHFTDQKRAEEGIKLVLLKKRSLIMSSPHATGTEKKRWCPTMRPPFTTGTEGFKEYSPQRGILRNKNACRRKFSIWPCMTH